MLNEKLEEVFKSGEAYLAGPKIDVDSFAEFGRHLKRSCEQLQESQINKRKEDEQAFCTLLIDKLIKSTQVHALNILSRPRLARVEKTIQLVNLTYRSQSLIALTKVQHRFGGRLGYHCLPHTLGVARYPDFLVMCAGANHDAVMRYANPPDFDAQGLKKAKKNYHEVRSKIADREGPAEAHRHMYLEKKSEIQIFKDLTEQKRLAGWNKGCSEYDSFQQMETQIARLAGIIEKCDHENKFQEEIRLFKKQIHDDQPYRAALIKATIPIKGDFAPPGLAMQLNTIGNVSVFPGPSDLEKIEPSLRGRLIRLMDHVFKQVRNLSAKPPFKDPLAQLKNVPLGTVLINIKECLLQDAKENQDMILLEYLMGQAETGLIANQDLGAMMKEGAESDWLRHESIGLIVEENPYQSQLFFAVNQKLLADGGLADPQVHLKLRDLRYRQKWGIEEEEYRSALEFMDIGYRFIRDNLSFSQGGILRMQLYVYEPMKALQLAFEEPLIHGKINASDKIKLDRIIQEYEKEFCINGKLRDAVLLNIQALIEECSTAGPLCSCILAAMQQQFGPRFLLAPQEYGYVKGKGIRQEFLEQQDDDQL